MLKCYSLFKYLNESKNIKIYNKLVDFVLAVFPPNYVNKYYREIDAGIESATSKKVLYLDKKLFKAISFLLRNDQEINFNNLSNLSKITKNKIKARFKTLFYLEDEFIKTNKYMLEKVSTFNALFCVSNFLFNFILHLYTNNFAFIFLMIFILIMQVAFGIFTFKFLNQNLILSQKISSLNSSELDSDFKEKFNLTESQVANNVEDYSDFSKTLALQLNIPNIFHHSKNVQLAFSTLFYEYISPKTSDFVIQSTKVADSENAYTIEFYFIDEEYSIKLSLNSWKILEKNIESYVSMTNNLENGFEYVELTFSSLNILIQQLVNILEVLDNSSNKYFNLNNFEGFDPSFNGPFNLFY